MLVHPQFDPIAIHIGSFGIHWYGLMYLTAFMAFLWLGKYRIQTNPQAGFSIQMLDDMLFYGALGVILGGRLGYVLFYQPAHFFAHPAEIPAVWQGGMSFHGGFLGVLTAMLFVARKYQIRWLALMDFIAPLVPLGLGAGRMEISSTASCGDVQPTCHGAWFFHTWTSCPATPRNYMNSAWKASSCF